jgi:hypothetical protein
MNEGHDAVVEMKIDTNTPIVKPVAKTRPAPIAPPSRALSM